MKAEVVAFVNGTQPSGKTFCNPAIPPYYNCCDAA
jgi:hypothetical protein